MPANSLLIIVAIQKGQTVSDSLTTLLSRYISRLKGADYQIDERIGAGYLATLSLERVVMKFRGMTRFPLRSSRPFIGGHVTIRAKKNLRFGTGVTFSSRSHVDALSTHGVRLGNNTSVGRNTRIECTGTLKSIGHGLSVGDNVGLGTDCLYGCAGGIEIGNDTIVGNFVTFHSENHQISDVSTPIRLQPLTRLGITVGANCWIGAKVTVLDGVRIGDGCVFAAGAVVTAGHYPANGIYGGIPARLLSSRA